jgi:hypothetical protein
MLKERPSSAARETRTDPVNGESGAGVGNWGQAIDHLATHDVCVPRWVIYVDHELICTTYDEFRQRQPGSA